MPKPTHEEALVNEINLYFAQTHHLLKAHGFSIYQQWRMFCAAMEKSGEALTLLAKEHINKTQPLTFERHMALEEEIAMQEAVTDFKAYIYDSLLDHSKMTEKAENSRKDENHQLTQDLKGKSG